MAEFSLGTAALGTEVDLSGLDKGLGAAESKSKSSILSIGGILNTAIGTALGGAITSVAASLGGMFAGGIADAQEAARLMAATEQTIATMGNAAGRSAQDVADLASSLSDASGASLFGDDQVQQASNLLLTFGEIKGETFDLATALTVDLAQALGGAPKDQAMMLGKALNDPIHGMSALGKAGLTFSEEQKAAITAMQESGDMAGAQAVIIAELNKQVGGQAAAAAAATGGWSEFQGRLGEVFETIGGALLPVIGGLGTVLLDTLMPAVEAGAAMFGNLMQAIQHADEWSSSWIETLGFVIDQFAGLLGLTTDFQGFGDIISDIFQGLYATFTDAQTPVEGLVNVLSTVSPTFAIIVAVVQATLPIVKQIVEQVFGFIQTFIAQNGDDITASVKQAWQLIQDIIAIASPLISGIVLGLTILIRDFLTAHGEQIVSILNNAWTIIKNVILGALEIIKGILQAALAIFRGDWQGAWDAIRTMSEGVVRRLWEIIKAGLDLIANVFGTSVQGIIDTWRGNWNMLTEIVRKKIDEFVQIGADIVAGIKRGIANAWNSFMNWVHDQINKIPKVVRDLLGISSPSKIMIEIGENFIQGFEEGIANRIPALMNVMSGMTGDLLEKLQDFQEQATDIMGSLFGSTATIDRVKADMIKFIDEVREDPKLAGIAAMEEQEMDQALEKASKIMDPREAAEFLQLRLRQIKEATDLRSKLLTETDPAKRKSLEMQLDLISSAQAAEQKQLALKQAGPDDIADLGKNITSFIDTITPEQTGGADPMATINVLNQILEAIQGMQSGNYTLNVSTMSPTESILQDFAFLQAIS